MKGDQMTKRMEKGIWYEEGEADEAAVGHNYRTKKSENILIA